MHILHTESVISLIDLAKNDIRNLSRGKKVVHMLLQIIRLTHWKTLHTSKERDASDRLAKIVQSVTDRQTGKTLAERV